MSIEITVTVKDSERTLKQKYLCYETPVMSEDDKYIKGCVQEAVNAFGSMPDSVTVRSVMPINSFDFDDESISHKFEASI